MTIKDTMLPVVSSYHGNPAQAFGQTSPASRSYQQHSTSPGPPNGHHHADIYNHSSSDQGYVQTTSPQPNGFQTLTINRVRMLIFKIVFCCKKWWIKFPFANINTHYLILGTIDTRGIYQRLPLKVDWFEFRNISDNCYRTDSLKTKPTSAPGSLHTINTSNNNSNK